MPPPPPVCFCAGSGKTLAFLLPLVAHLHQQRCHRSPAAPEAAADHSTDSKRPSTGLATAADRHTDNEPDAAKKRQKGSGKQVIAPNVAEPADGVPDSKLDRQGKQSKRASEAVQLDLKGSKDDREKGKHKLGNGDTTLATLQATAKRSQGSADHAEAGPIEDRVVASGARPVANGPGVVAKSGSTAPSGPGAVVLAPSRELAAQTARCLLRLVKGLRLHCCLLTAAVAAGTNFDKVMCCFMTAPCYLPSLPDKVFNQSN